MGGGNRRRVLARGLLEQVRGPRLLARSPTDFDKGTDKGSNHRVAEGIRTHVALKDAAPPGLGNNTQLTQLTNRRRPLTWAAIREEVMLAQKWLRRAVHRLDIESVGDLAHVPAPSQGKLPLGGEAIRVGALKGSKARIEVRTDDPHPINAHIAGSSRNLESTADCEVNIGAPQEGVHSPLESFGAHCAQFPFVARLIFLPHEAVEGFSGAVEVSNLVTRVDSRVGPPCDGERNGVAKNRLKGKGENSLNSA